MVLRHRSGWDRDFARRSPWFWPLRAVATDLAVLEAWPTRAHLDAVHARQAQALGAAPLRFGSALRKQDRHDGTHVRLDGHYDVRITRHAEVPTREHNWHDLLNALCFATFPHAKRALHRRQCAALVRRVDAGSSHWPSTRSAEQDALTLFDEGGVVVASEQGAYRALSLAAEAERPAAVLQAIEQQRARVVPFGHALFEHLLEALRCPGGSTRVVCVDTLAAPDAALLANVDRQLAAQLADATKFLTPSEGALPRISTLLNS